MKRNLAVMLLMIGSLTAAAQTNYVCVVRSDQYSSLMTSGGMDGVELRVEKTVPLGSVPFSMLTAPQSVTDSGTGRITMRLLRHSVVYVWSRTGFLGIARSAPGTPLRIPDADSVRLETLIPETVVPQSLLVAVPNLRIRVGNDSSYVSTLELQGDVTMTMGAGRASVLFSAGAASADTNGSWWANAHTRMEQEDSTINGQRKRREQQLSDSARNALSNAASALAAAQAAQGQGDRATYMSEHDSTLVCTDDYNAGDLNTTHPRIYVFTTAGRSLLLANASAHPNGARYTLLNAADGDVFLQYQTGDDPDNSGSGVDTVAQQQWRMIVAADGLWKVVTATPGPQGPQGATGPQGPQGVPGTTPSLAAYKDTASRNNQTQVITAHTPWIIGPQTVANTSSNLWVWQPWDSLKAYASWATTLITQDAAHVPNNDGLSSQSLSIGYNPNGIFGTGVRRHGMWIKFENHYNYGYSAPPRGPITETHFEALGENGQTLRWWTNYNQETTGRSTNGIWANDNLFFTNGAGVDIAHTDSLGFSLQMPMTTNGVRQAGTLSMYDTRLRWNVGATTKRRGGYITTERVDSSGLGEAPVLSVEDYGTDHLVLGSPNGRSNARGDFSRVSMYARGIGVTVNDIASEVVFSGARSVRRERSMFGSSDSLEMSTQAYVDSTVNVKIRAALSDTAAFFKRIELAFARSGGSGVDLITDQSISGEKTFNDSLKVTNIKLPPNVYTMKFVGTNPTTAGINWHFIDTYNAGGNTWAKLYVNDGNTSQSSLELRGFNGATFRSVMGNGTGSDVSTMNGGAIVAGATVTAPTGLFDSTEVRFILTDSVKANRWFQSDTGRWCYTAATRGTGNYVSTGYRYGSVSIKAQIRNEYLRHASFKIVLDTANGVKGTATYFTTTAVTANGYSSLGMSLQNSAWQMARGGMSYSGGGWGGESSIEFTQSYGSVGLCEYWLGSNNGYWVTVDVKIEYAIPNTGSSSWYAKVTNL